MSTLNYDDFINKNTLIVARRGCGKTTFVLSIYDNLIRITNFSQIYVVDPNELHNDRYSLHIPQAKLAFDLTDSVLNDLDNLPPNSLIVIDNCLLTRRNSLPKLQRLLEKNENTIITTISGTIPGYTLSTRFSNIFFAKEPARYIANRMYNEIKLLCNFDFDMFQQYMNDTPTHNFMYFKRPTD